MNTKANIATMKSVSPDAKCCCIIKGKQIFLKIMSKHT